MSEASNEFTVVSYRQHPDLLYQASTLDEGNYPPFIDADPVWAKVSPSFYQEFSEFQFFVAEDGTDRLVALSRNVPFIWDGVPENLPGYHQMLTQALEDWRQGKSANSLSPVEVIIHPEYRGKGLVELVIGQIVELANLHKQQHVVSAVRPTLKHLYPLAPIGEYANWRREDGQLFDPWFRAWERLGAEMLKAEPESTVIEAPVTQWQSWMNMEYPVSGDYWLADGLSVLTVDIENDMGRHCEPHVWFEVPLT